MTPIIHELPVSEAWIATEHIGDVAKVASFYGTVIEIANEKLAADARALLVEPPRCLSDSQSARLRQYVQELRLASLQLVPLHA